MNTAESIKNETNRKMCEDSVMIARNGIRHLHERVKEMADCVKGLSSPPNFAACRVESVVLEVFHTLQILANAKQITLRAEGLKSLPGIQADERRLYNAFYNLINNAIPESPGGGSITVRGSHKPGSPHITITVADTGRGMPADIRERLFTARAVSTKKSGTGLGMKIIKDVVEAHHGKIWVESKPGTGTTFHVQLPLDPTIRRPDYTKAS
jgi:signal transduction histidine kinase